VRPASALLGGGEIGIINVQLGGWLETPCATILRTSQVWTQRGLLGVVTPRDPQPLRVRAGGRGWEREMLVDRQGDFEIVVPPAEGSAEIVEVCFEGEVREADLSVLGVRPRFGAGR
jgi:hypothetical protein